MKESYIIFWEQNDTPAYRGEEVKWGWRGGEGSLRFANRNFYVFFFFKVFAEMSFMLTLWCNNTSKKLFFVACKPERIQGHHPAKGWPRPFVLWRTENITCLCSPSLWYGHVLEAFKAVSVSRVQRTTYQRQKSWRDQPCHGQGGVSVVWNICADRLT